jgi:hypothetical protein
MQSAALIANTAPSRGSGAILGKSHADHFIFGGDVSFIYLSHCLHINLLIIKIQGKEL